MKTKENSNLRKSLLPKLEEIKYLYLVEKMKAADVAASVGCSEATLRRFMSENNINRGIKKIDYEIIIPKIIALKEQGWGHTAIQKELGITNSTLRKALQLESEKTEDFEIKDYNSEFFWYFLGFFCADGHLDLTQNRNRIVLYQKDPDYLKILIDNLGCNSKLHKANDGIYNFYFKSTSFSQWLQEKEITSNKSLTIPFIKAPNEFLQKAFIRGYFDGDGCISFSYISGKFESKAVTITSGSKIFINSLKSFLDKYNIDSTINELKSKNVCYNLTIGSFEEIRKFYNLLYENCSVKMDRKYIIFNKLFDLLILNNNYK